VSEKIGQLKMPAPDGKMRLTDCADTETMFRIIQAIPSPKVEPLKRWLAKVGRERIDEIENPELSMERMSHEFAPCIAFAGILPVGGLSSPRFF
jgi:DNA-damage-inducible protein D